LNTGFSAQPGVYLGALQNSYIPCPSVDIQQEIIYYIEKETLKVQNAQNAIVGEIELLKEYKTSLISEVVTGKINVRDEVTAESLITA